MKIRSVVLVSFLAFTETEEQWFSYAGVPLVCIHAFGTTFY